MSERVLGIIGVGRLEGWTRRHIFEALYLTDEKVIVVRTAEGGAFGWGAGDVVAAWYRARAEEEALAGLSGENLLSTDENNYDIPYSRIKKVELKKFGWGAFINIITDEKKYKWGTRGIPGHKHPRTEDFEKILMPVFGDKLSVSK